MGRPCKILRHQFTCDAKDFYAHTVYFRQGSTRRFEQESGGNTKAVNSRTNALGQFQVLPANVPSWTKKHLGRSLTPEEFKNNPDAQVQVFNGEFGSYLDKALKDSPDEDTAIRKAAAAWYGSEGAMHRYDDPTKFRLNEPSFREYTSSVLNRTKKVPNLTLILMRCRQSI